jgi:protein ImuB
MTAQDQLPVLAFPRQDTPRTPPDDLARAIAALRGALEAELHRPKVPRDTPRQTPEESFSPVGIPKPVGIPRPVWRAGADTPRDAGPGRAGAAAGAVAPHGSRTDRDGLARRITAIHLPGFAMERWLRWAAGRNDAPPDDLPAALAIEGPHGPVIHAVNRAAAQEGIHPQARVVDMRALCPALRVEFADIAGDRAALHKLMLWTRRWCPWTAVDGPAGLVLDTTGSDHLWGGEAQMLRTIEEGLASLGLSASLAVAPTHAAAWALARFGGVRAICPADTLQATVAPLPVRALRLDDDTLLLLNRLGLKCVGDLAAVPRISLARRFSRAALAQNPLLRLDQMLGQLAEPVNAPDDPPRFAVQANLAEPVQDPTPHLPALCTALCDGMAAAGFGARRITVTVYRTDGEVRHVTVATAQATRDAAHLLRLFDGKLEAIDPGFGFDLITLGATVAEGLSTVQTRLDGGADDGAELARLIDRLTARLGAQAIRCPAPLESHIPERAEDWPARAQDWPARAQDWRPAMTGTQALPTTRPDRPVRMFEHPEEIRVLYAVPEGPPAQFVWRRVAHRVTRFAGPERIAPEWWRDSPGTRLRDYYRIEDQTGQRFWIYRDGVLGDGRGETPRWFVHGVFA